MPLVAIQVSIRVGPDGLCGRCQYCQSYFPRCWQCQLFRTRDGRDRDLRTTDEGRPLRHKACLAATKAAEVKEP